MSTTEITKRPHEASENDADLQAKRSTSSNIHDQEAQSPQAKNSHKKPGRKPLTTEATSKRTAQNRAAQRAFRERRQKYITELEEQVKAISDQQELTNRENKQLRALIQKLQHENSKLRNGKFTYSVDSASDTNVFSEILSNIDKYNNSTPTGFLDLSSIFALQQAAVGGVNANKGPNMQNSPVESIGTNSSQKQSPESKDQSPQSVPVRFNTPSNHSSPLSDTENQKPTIPLHEEKITSQEEPKEPTNTAEIKDYVDSKGITDNTAAVCPNIENNNNILNNKGNAQVPVSITNSASNTFSSDISQQLLSSLNSTIPPSSENFFAPLSNFATSPTTPGTELKTPNAPFSIDDLSTDIFTNYRDPQSSAGTSNNSGPLTDEFLSMLFPNTVDSDPVATGTTSLNNTVPSQSPVFDILKQLGGNNSSQQTPESVSSHTVPAECICESDACDCREVCPVHGNPKVNSPLVKETPKEMLGYVCTPSNRLNDSELDDLCSLMYKQAKCSEVQKRIQLERERLRLESELKLYQTKQKLAKEYGLP
ncbi:DNA-binding transcription factor yap1 [Mycoemilia scoparia]|uniref:DNA-binding transcription factor yap1 n=1 Tax=Mycoemilia scoparia TaxID=417184 RepID=A0A9W8A4N1_9FUNG|nr:DNA-binding transcription factor yap1 [Mycoemilia scoparia]